MDTINNIERLRLKIKKDLDYFLSKFNCKSYRLTEKFYLKRTTEETAIEVKVYFSEISFEIVNHSSNDKLIHFYIIPNKTNTEISIEQLHWFLCTDEIQNYLKSSISEGSFIPRLKTQIFETINIPVSQVSISKRNKYKVDLTQFNSYKILLSKYFQEYKKSYRAKNFMSCTSLSGSMCELILYHLLIEQESINKNSLNENGLGTLISKTKELDLEKLYRFDIDAFEKINKIRNKIVHPSNTIKENVMDIESIIKPKELDRHLKKILINFGIN